MGANVARRGQELVSNQSTDRFGTNDGATWHAAADVDVDIDHMLLLTEAWDAGAGAWTIAKRQQLANDLTRPQLIAVTDNVNPDQGRPGPRHPAPSTTSYRCTYARAWVQVKHYYALSSTPPRRTP